MSRGTYLAPRIPGWLPRLTAVLSLLVLLCSLRGISIDPVYVKNLAKELQEYPELQPGSWAYDSL